MMGLKLAIPLLGMLLWLLSIHSGSFATASILKGSPGLYDRYIEGSILMDNEYDSVMLTKFVNSRNNSVEFARSTVNRWATLERNLGWSQIHVERNTPAHGQLITNFATDETFQQAADAQIASIASRSIVNGNCWGLKQHRRECAKNLVYVNFETTYLDKACEARKKICSSSQIYSKYRTIDGSCNHESIGFQGQTFTHYIRLLPAHYNAGVYEPPKAVTRISLPDARIVTTKLIKNLELEDPQLTLAFMQWSQFVAHDLAQTAGNVMFSTGKNIVCCDNHGRRVAPRHRHPLCLAIDIPDDDPFYSKYGVYCMNYVRSMLSLNSKCTFGAIDQMNHVSHYLDGSQIYGSTAAKAAKLREYKGGKLRTFGKNFLPKSSHPQEDCQVSSNDTECYRAGDLRVNMHPQLTAMHVIWLREHNRIAESLANINSHWDDEKLYQEARRIVIAQIQHITYTHWVPIILGQSMAGKVQYLNYNEDEDASVSNSFAHAVLPFIHSLMHNHLKIYNEDRKANIILRLQEHFNNVSVIHKPGYLDGLIRGLATQPSQKMDMAVVSDITEELFKTGKYGYDALTLDLHRCRDHGLPSYVKYRKMCEMPGVNSFDDLLDTIPAETVNILRNLYANVEDIDLMVGGMAEKPVEDSLLGPVFTCLIGDQMYRTQNGDRYFYNHKGQSSSFTSQQLAEIQKTSLARVFCNNGDDIKTMQPNVFRAISLDNDLVDCKGFAIEKMDLFAWQESPISS